LRGMEYQRDNEKRCWRGAEGKTCSHQCTSLPIQDNANIYTTRGEGHYSYGIQTATYGEHVTHMETTVSTRAEQPKHRTKERNKERKAQQCWHGQTWECRSDMPNVAPLKPHVEDDASDGSQQHLVDLVNPVHERSRLDTRAYVHAIPSTS
jgi:hypothetical protein